MICSDTTGEETGLIGSDYLAEHPIVPLERIAAAISVDGLTGLFRRQ